MAKVTFQNNAVTLLGNEVAVGDIAQDFTVLSNDLKPVTLADSKGKVRLISVIPSIDTGVCAKQTRKFNEEAAALGEDVKILTISVDLPFAQARFCGAEGIDKVVMLSDFKEGAFGKAYGLEMTDGPLAGLHSRCLVVVDQNQRVVYTEQVSEISQEPNYAAALAALA